MRYLIILLIGIFPAKVYSQVKGLSASKLVSLSTQSVPYHQIEFEPSFSFFSANERWTNSHDREQLYRQDDSIALAKELGFRFTYGIGNKTELGSYITSNTSTIAVSVKHKFFDNSKVSFAGLGGVNIYSGDGVYSRQLCTDENGTSVVAGLIGNIELSEKWSADMDAQSQVFLNKDFNADCQNTFANLDVSFRAAKKLQVINSFNYYRGNDKAGNIINERFTITPGAVFESSGQFIVVVGFPVDVWGRNTEIYRGISFALTILFD